MAKLMENTFRATNIALAFEFAEAARHLRPRRGRGHRRRRDQALRLHGPLPVGRRRRPLHPGRPLLPARAAARRRRPHAGHRRLDGAGRQAPGPVRPARAGGGRRHRRTRASSSSASPTSRASPTCASRPPWRSSATSTWPACTSTTTTRSPRSFEQDGRPLQSVAAVGRGLRRRDPDARPPRPGPLLAARLPRRHRRHLPHARRHASRGHLSMIRNRSHVRTLNRHLRGAHPGATWPAAPADHTPGTPGGDGRRHRARCASAASPRRSTSSSRPTSTCRSSTRRRRSTPRPKPRSPSSRPSSRPTRPPATATAAPVIDRPTRYGRILDPLLRLVAFTYLCVIVAGVVVYKAAFIQMLTIDPFFATYGLIVSGYIVSRFVISLFYRPGKPAGIEPHVAIVMPAFNEEAAIAQSLRSLLALDYPAAQAADRRDQRRLVGRHAARAQHRRRARERPRRGHRLPREPRQAGRHGGRHPRHRRRDRRLRRLGLGARGGRDARARPGLRRGEGRRDLRPRGRAQHPRDLADADAGGPLLRGLQGPEGGRVGLQRRHLLQRAASPPTAARRSCPTSTGGRSRCSSASSRRSATTAR